MATRAEVLAQIQEVREAQQEAQAASDARFEAATAEMLADIKAVRADVEANPAQ
ncbi:MAG: hypothetical protein KME15_20585 [Drouetiella hepatica Uher 2000/2452]|jgi:hypothetical protein|uniref:Uncharacterized protein n=1 Tax=Drouetiella hepatica Uher 2000/2452 TaxID=904376 RepID=A0A951QEI1_9CYAN|nr:hypothetical protein [Drouetiella hepatica Uher 2000/2452]